ncbi:tRNA preQ1(34) S-adenosylmethionine ribosyltransferase-isomerase QueA [Halovulum sp. GXIMD14793]
MSDLLSDYDFDLPESLIALRPAQSRPAARLLVATPDRLRDAHVSDLGEVLRDGDLLVFNNTKVIPARLRGMRRRDTAHGSGIANIEVTLIEPGTDGHWQALCKPARRLAVGDVITFSDDFSAEVLDREGGEVALKFSEKGDVLDRAIAQLGELPLPPYIAGKRAADERDTIDYQTVLARVPGALAAPTAALHFDTDLLGQLAAKGVQRTEVTLHVGAGTFLPVKTDDVRQHRMHSEWGEVRADAAEAIEATRAAGGRVIPVGTTSLRLLETAATGPGRIAPWTGNTDIFIRPGHEFRLCDGLMTNFHLPKSTLLMLVSALMGRERILQVYAHAVAEGYRFFSYGDSSLLLPDD